MSDTLKQEREHDIFSGFFSRLHQQYEKDTDSSIEVDDVLHDLEGNFREKIPRNTLSQYVLMHFLAHQRQS